MDRSEVTKTLRQINGRTQVAVDLTSVQTKFAQVDESIGDLSIDVANLPQDLADLQVLPDVATLSNNVLEAVNAIDDLANTL